MRSECATFPICHLTAPFGAETNRSIFDCPIDFCWNCSGADTCACINPFAGTIGSTRKTYATPPHGSAGPRTRDHDFNRDSTSPVDHRRLQRAASDDARSLVRLARAEPGTESQDRPRGQRSAGEDGAEPIRPVRALFPDRTQGRSDVYSLPAIVRGIESGGIADGASAAERLSGADDFISFGD